MLDLTAVMLAMSLSIELTLVPSDHSELSSSVCVSNVTLLSDLTYLCSASSLTECASSVCKSSNIACSSGFFDMAQGFSSTSSQSNNTLSVLTKSNAMPRGTSEQRSGSKPRFLVFSLHKKTLINLYKQKRFSLSHVKRGQGSHSH